MKRLALCSALALVAGGCVSQRDAMRDAMYGPQLSPVSDPSKLTGVMPVSLPIPAAEEESAGPNSLWRTGSRAFFKDQRAARVGDILTVKISIQDKAQVSNNTSRSRTGSSSAGISGLLGFENHLDKILPNDVDPQNLIGLEGESASQGTGSVNRAETIDLTVAAVVTQVMANGNLVIAGSQEVKINAEMRELTISGVIRPQDISAENTILHTQIAEARINYGGRGDLSVVQRPRWGQRLYDVAAPY